MSRGTLQWWSWIYNYIFGQPHISHTTLFQRNGILSKMFEHFSDAWKPQMLNATLACKWFQIVIWYFWAHFFHDLPKSFSVIRRCLARPWKLNVRTYSPRLVSDWRTRNTPWLDAPPWSTIELASALGKVPWNLQKKI